MKLGSLALAAGSVVAMICMAAVESVYALPAQNVRGVVAVDSSVGIESVRCNCVRRVHRRRYVRHYVPDAAVPLYPAPPVGVTFRKLFDAGFF